MTADERVLCEQRDILPERFRAGALAGYDPTTPWNTLRSNGTQRRTGEQNMMSEP